MSYYTGDEVRSLAKAIEDVAKDSIMGNLNHVYIGVIGKDINHDTASVIRRLRDGADALDQIKAARDFFKTSHPAAWADFLKAMGREEK
jgi:hypothetical protein